MQVGNLVNGVCHFEKPQGSLGSICGCQPAARRLLNEKKMEACLGSVEFVLTFDASVHMVKSYRPIPDMSRQLPQRLIFLCKSPYNLHCLLTSNLGRNINSCYKLILILYHWWRELGLQTSSEQQMYLFICSLHVTGSIKLKDRRASLRLLYFPQAALAGQSMDSKIFSSIT